ncbi:hypothetical protein SAMN05421664_2114 [Chryseobacterium soldanellicola]|uniref:C1q domain-containing protein n=1 Tax=Chryseobacterium soldanellicola TaxID=311333 RepID=A0A1H1CTF1_9FLAO|nr:hypothetical protein [Chryseobacterium soldanellicola]SDQ67504.1 hypothetical protein SAMN05421664_2114 [Chryseobacterium soldanellicola]
MKKKSLTILLFAIATTCIQAQVGINTASPKSTLDVAAKNATGATTNVDGLLIPRVDRQRAQSMTGVPASTLIYVNSITTGAAAGTAINIDAPGYYYFDETNVWTKLKTSAAADINIYKDNGTLTSNRTVSQVDKTLAFTGTATNAFSVDGNTLSVDAANNRVGIGTAQPTSQLHTTGTVRFENYPDYSLLATNANGELIEGNVNFDDLGIPRPAVFELSTNITNFLNGVPEGGKQNVPMALVANYTGANGITFNASTNQITYQPGLYQISFVYEAKHDSPGCTISSHIVDFPGVVFNGLDDNPGRVHSTAAHIEGINSYYGGTVTYTVKLTTPKVWRIALGRGASGNCTGTGNTLFKKSTQLSILRIGN